MKVSYAILISMLTFVLTTCSGVLEPDYSSFRKLAFTAVIDGQSRIVEADCDDLSDYKIISPAQYGAAVPLYSPDKRYLLYGNGSLTVDNGYHYLLYDRRTGETRDWPDLYGRSDPWKLTGQYAVWDLESRGFYFSESFMSIPRNIKYLNIETNEVITISADQSSAPMGMKNAETLIVLSMKSAEPGIEGYHYMNLKGEFLGPVDNPHLKLEYDENHVSTRLATEIEYYHGLELFVFELVDTTEAALRICMTNLDGSYFEEFSSGYRDSHPTYNSIDNVIYFDRFDIKDSHMIRYPIMKVDVETKRVSEFFRASRIPGAEYLVEPDF